MTGTATITGYTGPGNLVTALGLTGVTSVTFDIEGQIISFNYTPTTGPPRTFRVAMNDISSVTTTIVEATSLAVTVTNA